jgi:hypothetical protein
MPLLRCVGRHVRWVRNPRGMHRIHTTVNPMAGGNTVVTLWDQGLRCLEVACTTCHCYGLFSIS